MHADALAHMFLDEFPRYRQQTRYDDGGAVLLQREAYGHLLCWLALHNHITLPAVVRQLHHTIDATEAMAMAGGQA